ncbi:MAG: glycosyltransferase family 39 protein [Gammaproteobacteria bacterium]|nr:glycosyltransferase family 39 protein [Gammaproteobacteria bacterium]
MLRPTNSTLPIKLALVVIVLLGAYLRLNATLHTTVQAPLRADAGEYFSYAFNLRHDGVYSRMSPAQRADPAQVPPPDAMRSPGYPLALLAFAGGLPTERTILDITLMQALLGVVMIPLVYLLGRPLLGGAWALLPALLVAFSPQLVTAGTYVLSETLFAFLLLTAIVTLDRQFRVPEKKTVYALLAGLILGLAALTRPTLQYLLPALLVAMLPLLPAGTRWRNALGLVLGFAIVFTPWILRNLLTLGVASDPTLTISTLVHGHYPGMMFEGKPETLGYPYRFDPRIAEISASTSAALVEILRCFRSDPSTYLDWYAIGKPLSFLGWGDAAAGGSIFTYPTSTSPYFDQPLFRVTMRLMQATHWAWVVLALLSVLLLFVPRVRAGFDDTVRITLQLAACVLLYFIAVHVAGFPIARYSIPVLPAIYLLAAFGLKRFMTATANGVSPDP